MEVWAKGANLAVEAPTAEAAAIKNTCSRSHAKKFIAMP
jgi:hypothetical protein